MRLAKLPKIGDIVKFKLNYTFTKNRGNPASQYPQVYSGTTMSMSVHTEDVEVVKGTLAEVVDRTFHGDYNGMSDDLTMYLALSVLISGELVIFKIDYNLHKGSLEVLKSSKALKLLYEQGK